MTDTDASGPEQGPPAAPDQVPVEIPVLAAAPADAFETAATPGEPPPLRALDVFVGIGLIWPLELLGQTGLRFAGAVLLQTGLSNPPGWGIHPIIAVPYMFASAAWTCTVVWLLACRLKRRTLADGLALRSPGRFWLAWSTALGVLMAVAAMAIFSQWGRRDTPIGKMGSTSEGLACLAVLALMIAPLCEEVYYRGFIFPALRRSFGTCVGGLVAAGWFTAIHALQLRGAGGIDAASLACVAGVGLVLVAIRHRTASLLPCIAVHFTYNATQIVTTAISMPRG